ncbi:MULTISPECIES: hypothetical protein [Catenuloplanes]|uniref:Uncharacterized protein n=1 Tax=Catenuloplanes niger TaxID=587534 RepID=A0AAE3ZNN9_9ACTN|nr:hypothetical protein [Catenuloplanes niger]MDR7323283.1 hypothetical protein [Catenuloplanes niger]
MARQQRALRIELGDGLGLVELRRHADENGRTWAEIRMQIPLGDSEAAARRQLIALLLRLRELAADVAARRRPGPRP